MEWGIFLIIVGLIACGNDEYIAYGIPILIWGVIIVIELMMDTTPNKPQGNNEKKREPIKPITRKEETVETPAPKKKRRRGRKKKKIATETSKENDLKIIIPSHEKSKASHKLADKTPAEKLYNKTQPKKEDIKQEESMNTTPRISSTQPSPIDFEVYVIIRFDNYYRDYTYLAPKDKFLQTNERVRIATKEGPKYVTVVKGNHKCPRKTDMTYKRLEIL